MKLFRFKTWLNEASLDNTTLNKSLHGQLRGWKFIEKLKNNEPFELVTGEKVILKKDPEIIKKLELQAETGFNFNGIKFEDTKGQLHTLKSFKKTVEFGSSGQSGTAKEDFALEQLNNAIHEEMQKTGQSSLLFKMNLKKPVEVVGAVSTPGTPKSDFHLIDTNGNAVFWISHKDGRSERDFQQWGGITEREIAKFTEVQSFINKCNEEAASKEYNSPGVMPNKTTWASEIESTKLKLMSVYGVDYGSNFEKQNVNVCFQGNLSLKKEGKYYTIVASSHTNWNGEIPDGGYEPVFMCIYKGDRSQGGLKGARIVISPKNCRKVNKWI